MLWCTRCGIGAMLCVGGEVQVVAYWRGAVAVADLPGVPGAGVSGVGAVAGL